MDERFRIQTFFSPSSHGKKWGISLLALIPVVALISSIALPPAHHAAHAAGATLTITPTSSTYSAKSLIKVQGTGYAASETVSIYWNYTGPGTGTLKTSVTAAANGTFKASINMSLAPTGLYTIAGIGQSSGAVATTTFQLLPQIYVGPIPYTSGAKLHIDGNAFSAGESVNIYWNYTGPGTGTLLAAATGNATGSFVAYAYVPGGTTSGSYTVAGVGQTSNAVATVSYVIPSSPPKLTITPASGSYSAWNGITVQGTGYAVSETVNIYWNYTGSGTGTLETSATTDASGSFSADIARPLAATGTYTIAGVGQSSALVATGTFLLLPQIYGGPLDTGPGTQIHVNGNAFGNGETVNIYWNYTGPGTGSLIATANANATGSFQVNAFIPSDTPVGFSHLAGVGQTSNAVGTSAMFVYPPTLALAPVSGAAGMVLTTSAYGFTAYENVSLYWNNAASPFSTAKTSVYGYLSPATFTIPTGTAPGAYQIKAVGATSHMTITNTFTVVAPGLTLQSTSGPAGATVRAAGQGFSPRETVNVLWNYTGTGTGTMVATATAGPSGVVSTNFTVPGATTGTYTVAMVGSGSNDLSQSTFTVDNGLASSPISTSPGATVVVAGSGFQAGEAVELYWDSTQGASLGAATADASGNISQKIALPASASPGSQTIIGVGQISQQSFSTQETIDTPWSDFGFDGNHDHQNSAENTLGASNVGKLQLKWTATTNIKAPNSGCGAIGNVSSPIYANGIVYYATDDGYLNAYDAKTGAMKWQFNSGTSFPNCSSPLYDSGTDLVFFGEVGYNGAGVPTPFYALNAQTGTLVWSLLLPWNEYSFPTIAFNTLFVGMSREGYSESLYAIDDVTGLIKWIQPATGGVWGEVVADPAANMIFNSVGNPGPQVTARDPVTGAVIWQFNPPSFGDNDDVGAPLTLGNGVIYADSKNGITYALNESTGAVIWSTTIGQPSNEDMSAPALSPDGILYVGSIDSPLYALNASNGSVVWKYTTRGPVYSSPALVNGVVYVASTDHYFYALNAATGALLWSYLAGGQSYASPIVVNGWLYCGASDGKLYAFSL